MCTRTVSAVVVACPSRPGRLNHAAALEIEAEPGEAEPGHGAQAAVAELGADAGPELGRWKRAWPRNRRAEAVAHFPELVALAQCLEMRGQGDEGRRRLQRGYAADDRPLRVPGERPVMARWRESVFVLMKRNARDAASYFHLPPNRVVELGMQVQNS